MNCPMQSEDTAEILLGYAAGRLDRAGAAKLEMHLKTCAVCAEFCGEHQAMWSALDAWEPAPVSMGFNRGLWAKIDAAAAAPWYVRLGHGLRLGTWKPVAPLAVAALVIAGGFLLDHPSGRTQAVSEKPVAAVSVAEAEQVEETLDDIQLLYQFESAAEQAQTQKQM